MNILAFLAYSIIMTFTPGPTNVVILATVQNQGTRKGLEFAAGATLAFALLLAIAATLSGVLRDVMPSITPAMGVVGAAYMLYLAYRICTADGSDETGGDSAASGAFKRGFVMQFVNPKVVLFTLTVITNFVTPFYSSPIELGAFVTLITAIGCAAFLSWVMLGAVLRRFLVANRSLVNVVMALFLAYSAYAVSGLPALLVS